MDLQALRRLATEAKEIDAACALAPNDIGLSLKRDYWLLDINAVFESNLDVLPALLDRAERWAQVQGMKDEIRELVERCEDCGGGGWLRDEGGQVGCERCILPGKLLALIDAPTKER